MSEPMIPCPKCSPASIPALQINDFLCPSCHGETYVPASVLDRDFTAAELHLIIQAHLESNYERQNPATRFMFLHHLHRNIDARMQEESMEFHAAAPLRARQKNMTL